MDRSVRPTRLEADAHSQLGGEGNSHGRAGPEEISQPAFGYFELLQAGERDGCRTIGYSAYRADDGAPVLIGHHLTHRNGELRDVHGEIGAGIIAVEEIEELGEGINLPALVDLDGTRDAQVGLNVGRSAEFIETGVDGIVATIQ